MVLFGTYFYEFITISHESNLAQPSSSPTSTDLQDFKKTFPNLTSHAVEVIIQLHGFITTVFCFVPGGVLQFRVDTTL